MSPAIKLRRAQGKQLKAIRLRFHFTLVQFSKRLGFTSAYLCLCEQGKRNPLNVLTHAQTYLDVWRSH